MKVSVLQKKLKEGFSIIERASSKSLSLPILNTALLQAEKNFLSLTATDLEIGIKWWALAKVEKPGQATLPISLFSGFLGLLPEKPLSIQGKEGGLLMECGNFKDMVRGLPPEDFPIVPEVQKDGFLEVSAGDFCSGLEQVADIAAVSQTRPEISGVFFSFQEGLVKMAATDSFRLGEKTIFFDKESFSKNFQNKEVSFIAPQRTAREIIAVFGGKKGKIKIHFAAGQVLVESQMAETAHPEIQLVSKLIDGEYPAYQEIVPKKHETRVVLNKNEFLNHLRAAAIFGGKMNEVKLQIDPARARVEFLSQSPDLGEHSSFMPGQVKGSPLEISFNHRFLASGLNNIKSSEVIFELQKEEGPAILKSVGDNSYFYVVMPIKAA